MPGQPRYAGPHASRGDPRLGRFASPSRPQSGKNVRSHAKRGNEEIRAFTLVPTLRVGTRGLDASRPHQSRKAARTCVPTQSVGTRKLGTPGLDASRPRQGRKAARTCVPTQSVGTRKLGDPRLGPFAPPSRPQSGKNVRSHAKRGNVEIPTEGRHAHRAVNRRGSGTGTDLPARRHRWCTSP